MAAEASDDSFACSYADFAYLFLTLITLNTKRFFRIFACYSIITLQYYAIWQKIQK